MCVTKVYGCATSEMSNIALSGMQSIVHPILLIIVVVVGSFIITHHNLIVISSPLSSVM